MENNPAPVRFLTVAEVAEILRVSKMTVYRLCDSGDLPCVRIGRSYRVEVSQMENYINTEGRDSDS